MSDLNLHKLIDTKVKDHNFENMRPTGWPNLELVNSEYDPYMLKALVEVLDPLIGSDQKAEVSFAVKGEDGSMLVIDWGDGTTTAQEINSTTYTTFTKVYSHSNTTIIPTAHGYKLALIRGGCWPFLYYDSEYTLDDYYTNYGYNNFNANDIDFNKTATGALTNAATQSWVELRLPYITTLVLSSTQFRRLRFFKGVYWNLASSLALEYADVLTLEASNFSSCTNLKVVKFKQNYDSTFESLGAIFNGCSSLQKIIQVDPIPYVDYDPDVDPPPTYEYAAINTGIFGSCYSLIETPKLMTATSSPSGYNINLRSLIRFKGMNLGSANILLSYFRFFNREAIVEVFENLASESRTINITNCIGTADITSTDRAIATGKGWTVTG